MEHQKKRCQIQVTIGWESYRVYFMTFFALSLPYGSYASMCMDGFYGSFFDLFPHTPCPLLILSSQH